MSNGAKALHLYNPMSCSGAWTAAFNNGTRYTNTLNSPYFPTSYGLIGRAASDSSPHFLGEIGELMIFDHELSQAERDALATNYFNQRFNLW